jgi:hypothetical protein
VPTPPLAPSHALYRELTPCPCALPLSLCLGVGCSKTATLVVLPSVTNWTSPGTSTLLYVIDTVNGTNVSRTTVDDGGSGWPQGVVFDGLVPNRTYAFIAVGRNAYGLGEPSPPSKFTTLAPDAGPVLEAVSVRGLQVGQDSVSWAWDGVQGAQFMVFLEVPDGGPPTLARNTSDTAATVGGLVPGLPYFAFVVPVLRGVQGPRSYRSPWPCFPGASRPARPNVTARPITVGTKTGVVVHLSPADGHTMARRVLIWRDRQQDQSPKVITLDPAETMCSLMGEEYNLHFSVEAYDVSCAGDGDMGSQNTDATSVRPPAAGDIRVHADSNITLTWRPNPGVTQYEVSVFNSTCPQCGRPLPTPAVVINASSLTITNAATNVTFVFAIVAVGNGLRSYPALSPPAAVGTSLPGQVRNFSVLMLDDPGCVHARWMAPTPGLGDSPVLSYTLLLEPVELVSRQVTGVASGGTGPLPVITATTVGASVSLCKLAVDVPYRVSLVAASARGPGRAHQLEEAVMCSSRTPSRATVAVSPVSSGSVSSSGVGVVLVEISPPADMGDGAEAGAVSTLVCDLFAVGTGASVVTPLAPSSSVTRMALPWAWDRPCCVTVVCRNSATGLTSAPSDPSAPVTVSRFGPPAPTILEVFASRQAPSVFTVALALEAGTGCVNISVLVYAAAGNEALTNAVVESSGYCEGGGHPCTVVVHGNSTSLPVGRRHTFVAVASNSSGVGQRSVPVSQVQEAVPPPSLSCVPVPGDEMVQVQCAFPPPSGVAADLGRIVVTATQSDGPRNSGPISMTSTFKPVLPSDCSAALCIVDVAVGGLVNGQPTNLSALFVGPTSIASSAWTAYTLPCSTMHEPWVPPAYAGAMVVALLALALQSGRAQWCAPCARGKGGFLPLPGAPVHLSTLQKLSSVMQAYGFVIYHAVSVTVAIATATGPSSTWRLVFLGGSLGSLGTTLCGWVGCGPVRCTWLSLAQLSAEAEGRRFQARGCWCVAVPSELRSVHQLRRRTVA